MSYQGQEQQSHATEERAENARIVNMMGAIALADLVKTTMGPKGMDKILQSPGGKMTITNDGATILKSVVIDNPAARVLIDISRVQDEEVGDGTTSVCVFAGELLREADKLLGPKFSPMTIIQGYRTATDVALDCLRKSSHSISDANRHELLRKIAMTTLSSKILQHEKERFADLAVEAVERLRGGTDLKQIQVIKIPGATLTASELFDGFLLRKPIGIGCPRSMEHCRVMVANTAMDIDKLKITGGKVTVHSSQRLAEIERAEKDRVEAKCAKIVETGINVFVNRQLIYDVQMQYLAKHGILVIEHADFDGVERLALVTGCDILSTFDDLDDAKLGNCEKVEEILIGEERLVSFTGLKSESASTIVLRGASQHILDEAERSLHDALSVLSQAVVDGKVVFGGGCSEMKMAQSVDEKAEATLDKTAEPMRAYARALRRIPEIIAENAGMSGTAELMQKLTDRHKSPTSTDGIDVEAPGIGDVAELGITEAFVSKNSSIRAASEAAEQILRVDSILTAAERPRGQ